GSLPELAWLQDKLFWWLGRSCGDTRHDGVSQPRRFYDVVQAVDACADVFKQYPLGSTIGTAGQMALQGARLGQAKLVVDIELQQALRPRAGHDRPPLPLSPVGPARRDEGVRRARSEVEGSSAAMGGWEAVICA